MALATAHVEILADTRRFEPDLRKKLSQSGKKAGKMFGGQFSRAARSSLSNINIKGTVSMAAKEGGSAGKAFSKAFGRSTGRGGLAANLTKGLGKGLAAPISLLGKSALTVLSSITDIGGKGPAAFSALAAAAGAAVAAVAPLAGVIAAVPAALAGLGAGAAVLATAFSGLGEAISAGWSGDLEKFQQALDGLAPAAATVTRDFLTLKPALQALQEATQQSFFSEITGQLQQLSSVISGPIQAGMTNLASAMGTAAGSVIDFFSSAEGSEAIQNVFNGIADSVRQIAPAIQPLLQGIVDMAAAGAGSLGGIAPALAAMGNAMSNFANSGGLNEMLSGAGAAARELGAAFAGLWPGLQALGGVFGQVGGMARQMLIPVFEAVGGILQTLAPVFGAFANIIGGVLMAALPPVTAALQGIADIAAAILLPALQALGPHIVGLAEKLGPMLSGAVRELMPPLMELAKTIGGALATAFRVLGPAIAVILPIVIGIFSRFVSTIRTSLEIVNGVLGFFRNLFVGNWTGMWESISKIGRAIWETVWNWIVSRIMNGVSAVMNWFRLLRDGAIGVLTFIRDSVLGIFGDSSNWLVQAGKNLIQGLIDGIMWMSGKVGDAAGFIAGKVRGFFPFSPAKEGPLSGSGSPDKSGKKVASMFASGLQSNRGAVTGALRDVLANPAMSAPAAPIALGRNSPAGAPLGAPGYGGGDGRTVNNSRTTTVSAPITVRSNGADPGRVARRTADRLARLTTV